MATVNSGLVMIYGGATGQHDKADGVLVDPEKRKVVRSFETGSLRFTCYRNRYCTTEYGALVAVVESQDSSKLIEVST